MGPGPQTGGNLARTERARQQTRRLEHLFSRDIKGRDGGIGTSDGQGDKRRFALLHRDTEAGER